MGKWALEIRRLLVARARDKGNGIPGDLRLDDVQLVPGQHYAVRFTVVDGTTKARSVSDLIPIYLRP
jgi:hypothetical protein